MECINLIQLMIVIHLNNNNVLMVLMYKPVYQGLAVLELSEFMLYETYFDKLPRHFGEKVQNYTIWLLIVSY